MTEKILIDQSNQGVAFVAKIVPGSSKTCVSGLLDGMVKVKVAAAPEKGKANQCLIAFLAKLLGVRRSDVTIVTGHTKPVKHLRIDGITELRLKAVGRVNDA